ncbi:MAG: hypothetical protein ACKO9I_05160 [Sphaerospermopsis kisseleviana]|jgi:hypothetical protein|uniref:Uncharacterized protein n=3 Tax=Sphaerospermopsis TaxID=752201 RepID=A0A479ZXA3_9CYAN|nr:MULTISPECIES: hypothetical protein [Sphaerospermopsis]MEB3147874.1 hypothetical protein [Sphaerospermopsis sp.]BAZ80539.1 hypothetical protein NIES73_18000 [Sphaerospermopsis kisseleviana NIES-73]MBC5796510.1 hypothetical protein [Sphaerospermopsis sp. LEGE 00249]MBD2134131.1 hypothetical protein [Sphaerospermopsis sp. FACHB-1094]MBD2147342.1 hypothetical protein [Sphaerospermopsis sp. FACHB-1194]
MNLFTNFLRSFLLTTVFSFIAPIFLVGGILICLCLFGFVPGLQGLTEEVPAQILHFLATFGTGSPINGLFVISLTFGFVGGLFDIYAYYRYQILRIDS